MELSPRGEGTGGRESTLMLHQMSTLLEAMLDLRRLHMLIGMSILGLREAGEIVIIAKEARQLTRETRLMILKREILLLISRPIRGELRVSSQIADASLLLTEMLHPLNSLTSITWVERSREKSRNRSRESVYRNVHRNSTE